MKSYWSDTFFIPSHKPLKESIKREIAVIGGGLSGILTAFLLKERGHEVVILEKDRVASGVSRNTTAKITSQHRLIYHKLLTSLNEEKAWQYAFAHESAIKSYEEIIKARQISCDFTKLPAFVYSMGDVKDLEDEVKAANKLGIKAEFVTNTHLPFPVAGAVKFLNQAQFHPLKFIGDLAKELEIYEDTEAIAIEDGVIRTRDFTVEAEQIVTACHYPFFLVPGYFFLRMHQERSYVIALKDAADVYGMYIDKDMGGYSFRNQDDLLLLGGEGHRTGKEGDIPHYDRLRVASELFYPKAEEVYHWSAEDCMSVDGIPYIGKPEDQHPLYVLTGFNKWGMTSAMAGAKLIADQIDGHHNEYEAVFSPSRFQVNLSIKNFLKDGMESSVGLIKSLTAPKEVLDEVAVGEGKIIEINGEKVGVYRKDEESYFFVKVRCPHLGCELSWNSDEKSWDCPCHGSSFDYRGKVLYGPSTASIGISV